MKDHGAIMVTRNTWCQVSQLRCRQVINSMANTVRSACGLGPGAWWLETKWLQQRNSVADVHPLLASLQDARGASFMPTEHLLIVLDSRDPAEVVQSWLEGPAGRAPAGAA